MQTITVKFQPGEVVNVTPKNTLGVTVLRGQILEVIFDTSWSINGCRYTIGCGELKLVDVLEDRISAVR